MSVGGLSTRQLIRGCCCMVHVCLITLCFASLAAIFKCNFNCSNERLTSFSSCESVKYIVFQNIGRKYSFEYYLEHGKNCF